MITTTIQKLIERQNLAVEEAYAVMSQIMEGGVSDARIAALLIALKSKGEAPEEVAGFAQAMRDKGVRLNNGGDHIIDVCGTGGDNSGSFNISTAVAFTVAGSGVRVAKHGNRSISSKSGSADVLEKLGLNIQLSPNAAEQALDKIGIAFLFAPLYHPAMKHVAPVRKELAMKTVFNILGPLTNPAGTRRQLVGTFNRRAAELMSRAAEMLDMEKVCFVCTDNRFDEISLTHPAEIIEYNQGSSVRKYSVSHETFGYPQLNFDQLRGDSPEHNASIIDNLFQKKEKSAHFYSVAANAALALYCAGYSDSLGNCRDAAETSILSGAAYDKLNALRAFGEANS